MDEEGFVRVLECLHGFNHANSPSPVDVPECSTYWGDTSSRVTCVKEFDPTVGISTPANWPNISEGCFEHKDGLRRVSTQRIRERKSENGYDVTIKVEGEYRGYNRYHRFECSLSGYERVTYSSSRGRMVGSGTSSVDCHFDAGPWD